MEGSIIIFELASQSSIGTWQAKVQRPSICTIQVPQLPMPQQSPNPEILIQSEINAIKDKYFLSRVWT
ncbi:hypothetical protein SAMN05660293_00003 [Dyadobacter psychrophilus]|uniref:Uncharacterized protein n=1 Tax=Dyadobacter psychrophilus TaxID=651661 RepID=A0A1T5B598_9BACT|nr:hypothetical protein [Dyadobacter psychrophilus]SKB42434.1 hypothetical protein SAMN05660293_00003 [Dyadobacter psychrophilus]